MHSDKPADIRVRSLLILYLGNPLGDISLLLQYIPDAGHHGRAVFHAPETWLAIVLGDPLVYSQIAQWPASGLKQLYLSRRLWKVLYPCVALGLARSIDTRVLRGAAVSGPWVCRG